MLWVFGYGSLIWRPGFAFADRRPARLEGWQRGFVRYSYRHRGTPERPGLVVGLKPGGHCVGMAYAVTPGHEAEALAYLDEREGAGYRRTEQPVALTGPTTPLPGADGSAEAGTEAAAEPAVGTEQRTVQAVTYVPNPEHPSYFGEQDPARIAELVAHGVGESGSAYDYLHALVQQLEALAVHEPELEHTLREAARLRGESGGG